MQFKLIILALKLTRLLHLKVEIEKFQKMISSLILMLFKFLFFLFYTDINNMLLLLLIIEIHF